MSVLTQSEVVEKNKILLKAMNSVEVRIDSFPVTLMTVDRLYSYHEELQSIKDKFFDFSELVLSYSMETLSTSESLPKNQQGQELTIQYWNEVQTKLQGKMISHELEIRQKGSNLAAHKCLTEFEKQSLQIQKQQLELHEKREQS